MRQGGEPQGVQMVRQGEPTPYHCDFNSLYKVQAAFGTLKSSLHFNNTANGGIKTERNRIWSDIWVSRWKPWQSLWC